MRALRNPLTLFLVLVLLLAASCNQQGGGGVAEPPAPVRPENLGLVLDGYRIRFAPTTDRPLYGALLLAEAPDGRRSVLMSVMGNPWADTPSLRSAWGGAWGPESIPVLPQGQAGRLRLYLWDGKTWYVSETAYRTPLAPLAAPDPGFGEPGDWFRVEWDPFPPFRPGGPEDQLLPPEARNTRTQAEAVLNQIAMVDRFLSPESPLALLQTLCTPNGYAVRKYPGNPYISTWAGSGPHFIWYEFNLAPADPPGTPLRYWSAVGTYGPPFSTYIITRSDPSKDVVYYLYGAEGNKEETLSDGSRYRYRSAASGHWWLVRNKPLPNEAIAGCPNRPDYGLYAWEWYYLGTESPFPEGKRPNELWQEGDRPGFTWANPPGLERARRIPPP